MPCFVMSWRRGLKTVYIIYCVAVAIIGTLLVWFMLDFDFNGPDLLRDRAVNSLTGGAGSSSGR